MAQRLGVGFRLRGTADLAPARHRTYAATFYGYHPHLRFFVGGTPGLGLCSDLYFVSLNGGGDVGERFPGIDERDITGAPLFIPDGVDGPRARKHAAMTTEQSLHISAIAQGVEAVGDVAEAHVELPRHGAFTHRRTDGGVLGCESTHKPYLGGSVSRADGTRVTFRSVKTAVSQLLNDDPPLEYRYWVANKLRPNSGYYDYHYGLDQEFVERIDADWMEWYHRLNRPFLRYNEVTVTNL
jgi:hypothetical protein